MDKPTLRRPSPPYVAARYQHSSRPSQHENMGSDMPCQCCTAQAAAAVATRDRVQRSLNGNSKSHTAGPYGSSHAWTTSQNREGPSSTDFHEAEMSSSSERASSKRSIAFAEPLPRRPLTWSLLSPITPPNSPPPSPPPRAASRLCRPHVIKIRETPSAIPTANRTAGRFTIDTAEADCDRHPYDLHPTCNLYRTRRQYDEGLMASLPPLPWLTDPASYAMTYRSPTGSAAKALFPLDGNRDGRALAGFGGETRRDSKVKGTLRKMGKEIKKVFGRGSESL